ncbi:MAG: hypothetical protein M1833_007349 [Piccolia ochrophora]|nr:MAG: hypothetical protein M1833_007349 [Piccolia ochrophora]
MARLNQLLLSCLALLGASAASAVQDLTPDNFDQVVLKSGKPALVEFFAPWCGHCKTLAPIYDELSDNFAFASDKVSVAKVDADANKDLGKRFGVKGFPTLKWFDGKSDTPEDYGSGRDLDSLSAFITEKTGLKPKVKKALPSKVEMLTDSNFKAEVGGDKDVLVAFTAPWCGHCKTLAPIWETLAQDFATEPKVLVAKVDAESPYAKATAEEQDVKGYPTIKYFPAGSSTPVPYEGGRSEKDFVDFLNEHAGTHRLVGGGLDAKAGTVEALDAVVAQFVEGGNLATLTTEAQKALQSVKDVSAAYYLKVFEKLATNKGYVDKELARLQGLIGKGGLAPEKRDELTIRANILNKFVEVKETVQDTFKDEL